MWIQNSEIESFNLSQILKDQLLYSLVHLLAEMLTKHFQKKKKEAYYIFNVANVR